MKANWKAWAGIGVSAFFLWWLFRGEDLGAIAGQLASADPGMLLLAAAISTSGVLIRALRWRILLGPLEVFATLRDRWAALHIGFMVTNIYPARLGEIVRPYALSKIAPVSMSSVLGTVVLERLLDTIALLVLLLMTLLSPAFPDGATVMGRSIGYAASGAIVVTAAALGGVGLMIVVPHRVTGLVRALSRALPGHVRDGLVSRLETFLSGLELLRRPQCLRSPPCPLP